MKMKTISIAAMYISFNIVLAWVVTTAIRQTTDASILGLSMLFLTSVGIPVWGLVSFGFVSCIGDSDDDNDGGSETDLESDHLRMEFEQLKMDLERLKEAITHEPIRRFELDPPDEINTNPKARIHWSEGEDEKHPCDCALGECLSRNNE